MAAYLLKLRALPRPKAATSFTLENYHVHFVHE